MKASDSTYEKPWKDLRALLEAGEVSALKAFLDQIGPAEVARTISHLDKEEQSQLLTLLAPPEAANLIEEVPAIQAVHLIGDLESEQAAPIVSEMHSDQQADLLASLDDKDSKAILDEMAPEEAAEAHRLLRYQADVAGGLMIREYLSYASDLCVEDVLDDLRQHRERYATYDVQYAYVVDARKRLVGVLPIRDLLLTSRQVKLQVLMRPDPYCVEANASLDDLRQHFDQHPYLGLPVVDADDRLVGVLSRTAIYKAGSDEANSTFLKSSGIVGGEELRSMSLWRRSSRRLSWLSVNIVLNIAAASVIAFYQDTLAAVIALAVFLPIISDMSGCSGNQAVAVSIRELTLGLVKPREILRVVLKESSVGLVNGLVLGGLIGMVAWIWKGNLYLGLVVGSALAVNTLLAVLIGGLVPLVLRGFKFDPALASGPILTTITDMCGFFFVLSLASILLSRLT